MFSALIIVLMTALGAMCGGGLWAYKLNKKGAVDEHGKDKGGVMPFSMRLLPEILFGLVFGLTAWHLTGSVWAGVIGWALSSGFMQTGHGNFYHMRGIVAGVKDEPEMVEKILRPIFVRCGGDIAKPIYSWVCMGGKWLMIGLAVSPFGLLLAFTGPAAYWFSFRVIERESAPAEWISSACAGLVVAIALAVTYG